MTDSEALREIADELKYWISFNKMIRSKENLATTDDTNIITVPPSWPTIGKLTNWSLALIAAADTIDANMEQ